MSAFKQLTTKDVIVIPFEVNKDFYFTGNQTTGSNVEIEFYIGINPTSSLFASSSIYNTGINSIENTTCIYNSVKQLYFSNYLTSSIGDNNSTQSLVPGASKEYNQYNGNNRGPRFDNYLQTSLTQSRNFPTSSGAEISVISIPSKLYREKILPHTFFLNYTSSVGVKYSITDDGEGNLVKGYSIGGYYGSSSYGTGSYGVLNVGTIIGQIFYPHGIAVLTNGGAETISRDILSGSYARLDILNMSFSSSFHIYEIQYKCNIRENEFGYSLNPSLLSGSQNNYHDFATGSQFVPYTTTVGLYNDNQELLMIGKLSQPIPVSNKTDTTIIIGYDL